MKRIVLICLIILSSLFAFGVYAQTDDSESTKSEASASKVERLISENTPAFIKDGMQVAAKFLEDFRIGAYKSIQVRQDKISQDIVALEQEAEKDPVLVLEEGGKIKQSPLAHALKTVQLFFLKLIALVFASKLVFYGLSLLIFIIILRYMFG